MGKTFFQAPCPHFLFLIHFLFLFHLGICRGGDNSPPPNPIFPNKRRQSSKLLSADQSEHHVAFPLFSYLWVSDGKQGRKQNIVLACPFLCLPEATAQACRVLTLWNGPCFHPQGSGRSTPQSTEFLVLKIN